MCIRVDFVKLRYTETTTHRNNQFLYRLQAAKSTFTRRKSSQNYLNIQVCKYPTSYSEVNGVICELFTVRQYSASTFPSDYKLKLGSTFDCTTVEPTFDSTSTHVRLHRRPGPAPYRLRSPPSTAGAVRPCRQIGTLTVPAGAAPATQPQTSSRQGHQAASDGLGPPRNHSVN